MPVEREMRCNKCGKLLAVNSGNVIKSEVSVATIDGNVYLLCPACNEQKFACVNAPDMVITHSKIRLQG